MYQVAAYAQHANDKADFENSGPVTISADPSILKAFQDFIRYDATNLLGATVENKYTDEMFSLPLNPEEFTLWHLQILARNEASNITGKMQVGAYGGLLTDNQVGMLRGLVKGAVIAGNVETVDNNPFIIIDQSGFQWQEDFRNTGCAFFYPEPGSVGLPDNYTEFQNSLYQGLMGGEPRPTQPSSNSVPVHWTDKRHIVKGYLDLNGVAKGIAREFLTALESANEQASVNGFALNFRYLKAGMGFFADGLGGGVKPQLEKARIKGIELALKYLTTLSAHERGKYLSAVECMDFPYTAEGEPLGRGVVSPEMVQVKALMDQLSLTYGGAGKIDALSVLPPMPRSSTKPLVTATTNCADPHARFGNEGPVVTFNPSVDAMTAQRTKGPYANKFRLTDSKFNPAHIRLKNLTPIVGLENSISIVTDMYDSRATFQPAFGV